MAPLGGLTESSGHSLSEPKENDQVNFFRSLKMRLSKTTQKNKIKNLYVR